MSTPDPLGAIQAYGADVEVFEEYNCVPIRARIVRDLLKVQTESGARILKKVAHDAVHLDWSFLCAEHVAKSGFPNVPRFIRTRYGDPYVLHPTGTYYMTAWWPGRELDAQKTSELFDGVQILGEWHEAALGCRPQGIEVPRRTPFLTRIRRALEVLQRYHQMDQSAQVSTSFQQVFAAHAQDLFERVQGSLQRLEHADLTTVDGAAREQGWVCHGDYTRQNVILDGSAYTVWNYDKVYPGLPLMDIALYLHRYMPAYDWDPAVLASALERYRETSRFPEDGHILAALLAVPLRSMQVVSWYFQRARDWAEEDFVNALEMSLNMDAQRMFAVQEVFEGTREIPVQMLPRPVARQADPVLAKGRQASSKDSVADEAPARDFRSGADTRARPKRPLPRRAKNAREKRRTPSRVASHRPKLWGDATPADERE